MTLLHYCKLLKQYLPVQNCYCWNAEGYNWKVTSKHVPFTVMLFWQRLKFTEEIQCMAPQVFQTLSDILCWLHKLRSSNVMLSSGPLRAIFWSYYTLQRGKTEKAKWIRLSGLRRLTYNQVSLNFRSHFTFVFFDVLLAVLALFRLVNVTLYSAETVVHVWSLVKYISWTCLISNWI